MAQIAEAKSERLTYKAYSTATYDSTTEPVAATDPAATGGQVLRHVSHNLSLVKDNYRPNEKRQDGQRPMGQHGSRTVPGTINGYLSPGTQADLFRYVLRAASWTAAVTATEADFTSVAADSTTSKFTFAGGDPVDKGYRVGMGIRFTTLSEALNNSTNYAILGFGGTSNREVTVYPAPTTMSADSAFSMTSVGKLLTQPASALTNYKIAWEVYNSDTDLARLYTECRMGGFDLAAAVNANVTVNFNVLGRNRQVLSAGSAPFFTSPTAETTTDIPTSMEGLLRLNGATLGVCTGLNLKCNLNPQAAKVINPDGLVGAIFLEDAMIDGDFTAFLDSSTLLDAFDNETEMELLCYFPSTNAAAATAQIFYLPRIKINTNGESDNSGGKAIQCSFEAARYTGSGAGINSTTLQIWDTSAP